MNAAVDKSVEKLCVCCGQTLYVLLYCETGPNSSGERAAEQVLTVGWKTEIRMVTGFAGYFPFSVFFVPTRGGSLQASYYKELFMGAKTTPDVVGIACGGNATLSA